MQTTGSERFKKFLQLPFNINMIYPVDNEKPCDHLFDCWKGKSMVNWYKFTSDNKDVLEFYPTYYTITKNVPNAIKYMLSIPKTIDDFINDMDRFEIELYWTNWIDINFEPKEYLKSEEIKTYFINLLTKMGKSNELL